MAMSGLQFQYLGDERPRGFERRLDPERIVGATDSSGELMFLIKVVVIIDIHWRRRWCWCFAVEGKWWGRSCSREGGEHSHSSDCHQGECFGDYNHGKSRLSVLWGALDLAHERSGQRWRRLNLCSCWSLLGKHVWRRNISNIIFVVCFGGNIVSPFSED